MVNIGCIGQYSTGSTSLITPPYTFGMMITPQVQSSCRVGE